MIYTSYFKNPLLQKVPSAYKVAISVGVPWGWKGRRFLELAPTRAMLKMDDAGYRRLYAQILAKLDPKDIGDCFENCILLCWERDPKACHRSYVSEWLGKAGIKAEELTGGSLVVGQQASSL